MLLLLATLTVTAPTFDLVATVDMDGEEFAFTQQSGLSLEECKTKQGSRFAVIHAWPDTIIHGPAVFTCEESL